ncbi:putative DUF262 domain-containing protein [uncultured Gammaproteobacteria bacterium]
MNSPRILVVNAENKGQLIQQNTAVARALLNLIRETMLGSFGNRQQISVQDMENALHRLEECWPSIENLFERAANATIGSLSFVAQDRRKDHLTRLLFAKLLMRIPERPVPKSPVSFPRLLLPGLQNNVASLFSKVEWDILNRHAKCVFEYIGSDSDPAIMAQLKGNEAIQLFSERVFVSILLKFYRFNLRKSEFLRITNEAMPEGVPKIGDNDFCSVFEGAFDDYFDILKSEEGRTRIELSHGEEFLVRIRGIQDQYRRYKEGIAPTIPVRRGMAG